MRKLLLVHKLSRQNFEKTCKTNIQLDRCLLRQKVSFLLSIQKETLLLHSFLRLLQFSRRKKKTSDFIFTKYLLNTVTKKTIFRSINPDRKKKKEKEFRINKTNHAKSLVYCPLKFPIILGLKNEIFPYCTILSAFTINHSTLWKQEPCTSY